MRKANIEKKAERARLYEGNKPHVVLGTRPSDEQTKWGNCDLAKLLVTEEELSSLQLPSSENAKDLDNLPKYTNFGLDGLDGVEGQEEQLEFFFKHLPDTSVEVQASKELLEELVAKRNNEDALDKKYKDELARIRENEQKKKEQLARLIDLRNANARGIAFENRRRIIAAFSRSGNTSDSGYPEVQGELTTKRISLNRIGTNHSTSM